MKRKQNDDGLWSLPRRENARLTDDLHQRVDYNLSHDEKVSARRLAQVLLIGFGLLFAAAVTA